MSATTTPPETAAQAQPEPGAGPAQGWLLAGSVRGASWRISCVWGLVELRSELTAVPYLDDSSMHEQMVRFAASRIKEGHLPLTSWFPYLGLGSPQFLHYQSLPAMTAGTIGTVVDPDTVFRWSLYLLLALWPLAVYWCARLFGLGRWTAAGAAAVAPFLSSWAGIGYEDKAYVWAGYGVWTQLWASWTLPLAWGFTYRSLRSLRAIFPAVLFIMLTVALHFETGYLAFVPLVVWPFVVPSDLRRRLLRAVAIGAAALAASLWVIYPLLAQSHWAARNQILGGTPLENGYGAPKVLCWLFSGQLYDFQRVFPVVTILVGVGLVVCLARWRTFVAGRAIVRIWVVTLLMTFGRTTWGVLYKVVPGSSDIFIRRFEMGVQLSGLLLAGVAIVTIGRFVVNQVAHLLPEDRRGWARNPTSYGLVAGLCIVALVIGLAPAWWNIGTYAHHNATNVSLQAQADAQEGPQIDQLHRLREGAPAWPGLCRLADQLGHGLHRGRRPRVQVPREQGRRRGRLHAAHGVAHDRPRVLLRRHQPGRLPAVRHRLPHRPRDHVAPRSRPPRSAARASTACGRCPTAATSTSTTPPGCSRPTGPTSAPRARPCSSRR